MTSEKYDRALETRISELESEIERLNSSFASSLQQIRSLQLGRGDDAHIALIVFGVLAAVSLSDTVAVLLLWVLR